MKRLWPLPDISTVVAPAPGGSLAQYVGHLKSLGRPTVLGADGTQAWVTHLRGQLQRLPLERTDPPDPAEIRRLLRLRGVWLVNYLVEGSEAHRANCFDYVCRGPEYVLERLPPNARRDVRRGLRQFAIRLCTWDELAEKGFAALADTVARHGDAPPPADAIQNYVNAHKGTPFYDVWGAWDGEELAAWMTLYRIDDWTMIDIARSRTSALKGCPNNAILYAATHHYLVKERLAYVAYGLSTVQVNVDVMAMHRYKTRMGYEAIPLRLVFAVPAAIRPLLASRPASWGWERLAGLRPQSAILRKVAGMSRLLSGREKAPLAWAEGTE